MPELERSIHHWISQYGYHAVPFAILSDPAGIPWAWIFLMLLAEEAGKSISLMLAYGFAVLMAADHILFWIGWFGGQKLINKLCANRPEWAQTFSASRENIKKRGALAVIFGRYLPLLGRWMGLGAGLAGMNYAKFSLYDAIGAAISAFGFGLLAHFVGRKTIENPHFYPVLLTVVVGATAFTVLGAIISWWRSRQNGTPPISPFDAKDSPVNENPSHEPAYPDGVPNPDVFGFIQLNSVQQPDFDADIAAICRILERKTMFVDKEDYENSVTAASVDEERNRFAWVECKSKEIEDFVDVAFHLFVRMGDNLAVKWEIETYNPYFGCQIEQFHWMQDHLVLLYHEKHDTFACSFDLPAALKASQQKPAPLPKDPIERFTAILDWRPRNDKPVARVEISDEWLVKNETIIYRSKVLDQVDRLALPELKALEPWTAEHARSIDALPPNYDEMNEQAREWSESEWA